MSELAQYRPTEQTISTTSVDPTGGRLIAWAQAAQAAHALAKSLVQTTFVPTGETVGNATAKILMGDELGLSPIAALRSIYVVHGTPALYARSMVALAQSRGHQIWTEETSDQKVVVCGQRLGSDKVERAEWTIARATKAGYTNNKKYGSTPQEMLYSKAAAEVARKVAADVLAGIPFSVEDLELEHSPTVTVTRGAVTTTAKRAPRTPAPEPAEPDFTEPPAPEHEPPTEPEPEPLTDHTRGHIFALLSDVGIKDRDAQIALIEAVIGHPIKSRGALTEDEGQQVVDDLKRKKKSLDLQGGAA
jgi:hypothetical protein